jgi:hypothetical protein
MKTKPIHKFNNGYGATICNKCSVVITVGHVHKLYCDKCEIINKEFVPYKIAKDMKSIEFVEPCLGYWALQMKSDKIPEFHYNTRISTSEQIDQGQWYNHNEYIIVGDKLKFKSDHIWSAPTYQQALRWLRKKHKMHCIVTPFVDGTYHGHIYTDTDEGVDCGFFESHEEAELECIKRIVLTLKKKQK